MTSEIIKDIEKVQKKRISKNARLALTFALITCILIFVFQLFPSIVLGIIIGISGKSFVLTTLGDIVFQIISYVFYIGVPFLIAFFLFKFINDPNKTPLIKRCSPKFPVLYILGAIGCCYLINFIFIILFPSITELASGDDIVAKTPLEIALLLVLYAVLPAILEEWGFRHIILKNLLPYGKIGAIIISSILFGMGHLHPLSIINATTFGIILGACYEYTGSIKLTMLIHFMNNAIASIPSLIPEDSPFLLLFSMFTLSMMGVGIIAIIYYSINGYKRKKFTLKKPDTVGYKLTLFEFINRLIINYAFLPYLALFAFYIYIIFINQV